jgi:HSP20 family protein
MSGVKEVLMTKKTALVPWTETWFNRFGLPDMWRNFDAATEIKVEEFVEDGMVVVRAEVPGVDPDKDIEVRVEDGALHMRAERRHEEKEQTKDRYRSEFSYGSFTRVLRLPVGATEQDVKATYHDGILEVRLPMDTGKADAKKIAISRN